MRVLRLTWRDCLFVHWPVDRDALRSRVPDSLALDAFEGRTWVSALASVVENVRPRGAPPWGGLSFPQCNFRTYVRLGSATGVHFLSLDAASGLAVRTARALYGLPYYRATFDTGFDGYHEFRSRRVHPDAPPATFDATYRPVGSENRPEPGSLDAFLAERYRLFVPRRGRMRTVRVEHDRWSLRPAEADVDGDSLFAAAGLPEPEDDPRVRYCPAMAFDVHAPKSVER